jgi:catechol 2,3-dioxygenase-like lactoylglutathione lyase family enzyme
MAMLNSNLEVVLVGWVDARRRDDLATVERHLHPDVVCQGLREDLVCRDRAEVLQMIRAGEGSVPEVEGIELSTDGDQVLLGVRSPDIVEVAGETLDGAIYNVFTIADGLIVRIDEFHTREQAAGAMGAHREAAPPRRTPPAPVTDLIPFVHVADVARSVAFYEFLGFAAGDSYEVDGHLDWAALQSGAAQLMLARADEPVRPEQQAVLLYLYADDLHALQEHLRAHGVRVGGIHDGSPGPKQEMRLRDPDGYVLMVAQTDRDTSG